MEPDVDYSAIYDSAVINYKIGYYKQYFWDSNDHYHFVGNHELFGGPLCISLILGINKGEKLRNEDFIRAIVLCQKVSLFILRKYVKAMHTEGGFSTLTTSLSSHVFNESLMGLSQESNTSLSEVRSQGRERRMSKSLLSEKFKNSFLDSSKGFKKSNFKNTFMRPLSSNYQSKNETVDVTYSAQNLSDYLEKVTDHNLSRALLSLENSQIQHIINVDIVLDYNIEDLEDGKQVIVLLIENDHSWDVLYRTFGQPIGNPDILKQKQLARHNSQLRTRFSTYSVESNSSKTESGMEAKRISATLELIETEKNYVFMNALKPTSNSTIPENLAYHYPLPVFEYKMIFNNIDEILEFNQALLKELVQLEVDGILVDDFDRKLILIFTKNMEVYEEFVKSFSNAIETLEKLLAENITFKTILDDLTRTTEGRLDIKQLLMETIQRVPRYTLLVDALVKNTENEEKKSEMLELKLKMESFCKGLDKAKASTQIFLVYDLIEGCLANIINSSRWYISNIDCLEVDPSSLKTKESLTLFLLNDKILITKRRNWAKLNSIDGLKKSSSKKKPYKAIALFDLDDSRCQDLIKDGDPLGLRIDFKNSAEWALKVKENIFKKSKYHDFENSTSFIFKALTRESKLSFLNKFRDTTHHLKYQDSKARVLSKKWKDYDIYFHLYNFVDYKEAGLKNNICYIYQDGDVLRESYVSRLDFSDFMGNPIAMKEFKNILTFSEYFYQNIVGITSYLNFRNSADEHMDTLMSKVENIINQYTPSSISKLVKQSSINLAQSTSSFGRSFIRLNKTNEKVIETTNIILEEEKIFSTSNSNNSSNTIKSIKKFMASFSSKTTIDENKSLHSIGDSFKESSDEYYFEKIKEICQIVEVQGVDYVSLYGNCRQSNAVDQIYSDLRNGTRINFSEYKNDKIEVLVGLLKRMIMIDSILALDTNVQSTIFSLCNNSNDSNIKPEEISRILKSIENGKKELLKDDCIAKLANIFGPFIFPGPNPLDKVALVMTLMIEKSDSIFDNDQMQPKSHQALMKDTRVLV
ncbi:hypothetical protein ROZALSC1DRAFT_27153, partial [Rozella allomycis CSF55]